MKKLSGVYIIENIINGKVYIGASRNIVARLNMHKLMLKKGNHCNNHLQSAYNFYNRDGFLFDILEECEEKFIFSQENYWCNLLNSHDREYGYNIDPTSPYGKQAVSKETKIKMSAGAEKRAIKCYTIYGDFYKDFTDFYKCGKHFNTEAPNIHRKMNILFNKKNLIDSLLTKYILVDVNVSVASVKVYWEDIFSKIKECKGANYEIHDCFGKYIGKASSRELCEILKVSISSISGSASRGTYLRTLKITKCK
jgi:group I intron endonuclease